MKAKTISFSDMWAFRECPSCYLERVTRKRRPAETIYEAVGEAAHAAIAAPSEQRETILKEHISRLPSEQQAEAEKLMREHIYANERLAQADAATGRKSEKQLSWFDEVSGWTLKAKPDEIGFIVGGDSAVLQITDLKTARFMRGKHKEQLYFFGMVASLALNHRGPIKLVLRLLGSESEHVFWYSHFSTQRSLLKLRDLLAEIEMFLANPQEYIASGEHGRYCCCQSRESVASGYRTARAA